MPGAAMVRVLPDCPARDSAGAGMGRIVWLNAVTFQNTSGETKQGRYAPTYPERPCKVEIGRAGFDHVRGRFGQKTACLHTLSGR